MYVPFNRATRYMQNFTHTALLFHTRQALAGNAINAKSNYEVGGGGRSGAGVGGLGGRNAPSLACKLERTENACSPGSGGHVGGVNSGEDGLECEGVGTPRSAVTTSTVLI